MLSHRLPQSSLCLTTVPGLQDTAGLTRWTASVPLLETDNTGTSLMVPRSVFWPPPSGKRTVSAQTTSLPLTVCFLPSSSRTRDTAVTDTTSVSS